MSGIAYEHSKKAAANEAYYCTLDAIAHSLVQTKQNAMHLHTITRVISWVASDAGLVTCSTKILCHTQLSLSPVTAAQLIGGWQSFQKAHLILKKSEQPARTPELHHTCRFSRILC